MNLQQYVKEKENIIIDEFTRLYGEENRRIFENRMKEITMLFPDTQEKDKERCVELLLGNSYSLNPYPISIVYDYLQDSLHTSFIPLIEKRNDDLKLNRLIVIHQQHVTDIALLHELKHALLTQIESRVEVEEYFYTSLKTGLSCMESVYDGIKQKYFMIQDRNPLILNELFTEYDSCDMVNHLHQTTEIFPGQMTAEAKHTWQHNFFPLAQACSPAMRKYIRSLELMNPIKYSDYHAEQINFLDHLISQDNLEEPVTSAQKKLFLTYMNQLTNETR